jgi:hypothetical protein
MKDIRKYPAKLYKLNKLIKKFDVSPFDKNGAIKLLIFLSWIFFVLTYTNAEFDPDNFSSYNTYSKNYSNFTEQLSPVELPPPNNIEFLRSEIGTVSSFNVIILPIEPSSIDRERGPPFPAS